VGILGKWEKWDTFEKKIWFSWDVWDKWDKMGKFYLISQSGAYRRQKACLRRNYWAARG
jgi:hypothetical protein